jgi:hypothetical protein
VAAATPNLLSNARTNILFGFINCLANNNYTPSPDQWNELKKQISMNPVLEGNNTALPWTKACLEMASLHYYEDKILKKVFSKEFLDEYLSRDNNTLDLLQLLTLDQAVKCFHTTEYSLPPDILEMAKSRYPVHNVSEQLELSLARGIGGREYFAKHVALPNGFVAGKINRIIKCYVIYKTVDLPCITK